jgi:hypothetical protein
LPGFSLGFLHRPADWGDEPADDVGGARRARDDGCGRLHDDGRRGTPCVLSEYDGQLHTCSVIRPSTFFRNAFGGTFNVGA